MRGEEEEEDEEVGAESPGSRCEVVLRRDRLIIFGAGKHKIGIESELILSVLLLIYLGLVSYSVAMGGHGNRSILEEGKTK